MLFLQSPQKLNQRLFKYLKKVFSPIKHKQEGKKIQVRKEGLNKEVDRRVR